MLGGAIVTWTSFTIVCNEAEWIEAQVRSCAEFYDRVVVVDGAAKGDGYGKGNGSKLTGGQMGSTDGTQDILRRLEKEIPKLKVVYATRPWQGKTFMCNAALFHVPHGWLMQRDVDEFWHLDDLKRLRDVVEDSDYTDAEFYAYHYWGDRRHHMRLSKEIWGNQLPWRRLFRYSGERWESHEPPKLVREDENVLSMDETRALGLIMHHYSYCDLGQLRKKEIFYSIEGQLVPTIEQWRRDPESVPKNADLVEFTGVHPVNLPVVE
jgi:hypothetical protein